MSTSQITARAALLAIAAIAAAPVLASADTNVAQAESLFKDGQALMKKKEYAAACEKFEASQKLDPLPSTLLNLADCREKNGQIATAWNHFLKVKIDTTGVKKYKEMHSGAEMRANRLEGRVSYLTINVPDDNRVTGLVILRNGEEVDSSLWNQALPIDGGNYEIEGKAPGHEAWSTTVTVENEKDKESVTVPKFKEVIEPAVEPTNPEEAVIDSKPHVEPDDGFEDAPSRGMSGKRKLALGVGIGGVIALGVAGLFEMQTQSTYDDAVANQDPVERREIYDDAVAKRRLAVITAGVGLVCVGAAAFLWFTGGAEATDADGTALRLVPTIGADGVGVSLTGSL